MTHVHHSELVVHARFLAIGWAAWGWQERLVGIMKDPRTLKISLQALRWAVFRHERIGRGLSLFRFRAVDSASCF